MVYLGHEIFKEGIWTDDHKVETIRNLPVPNRVTELWNFLGFMNYYYHFIKGYVNVTLPLYNQISGDNATKKKKNVVWTEECQKAFDVLKVLCTSAPILPFTAFTKPFKLHTDASNMGLHAILCQGQDRTYQVIGYASWALSKSESHYPAHKLEFLVLKWAVTKSFQEYLYGTTFTVYSLQ